MMEGAKEGKRKEHTEGQAQKRRWVGRFEYRLVAEVLVEDNNQVQRHRRQANMRCRTPWIVVDAIGGTPCVDASPSIKTRCEA
jgi:hypothetical protein